ncbi:PREDICTED: uncharacterized protein LOC105555714 [Vollenhovia emeryi]|uniref:uncharacterized protein LOC105555714 n=1 Tax=Vollenhovia emeryi TaxID=411798 RepID=UPI0005F45197|nr:PREDICTED: uncharacterized protein LOC105555714 [Vollenhovia emeryi]
MSTCIFKQLLDMLKPFLFKKSHRALIPEQRLALTLRYLATGDQTLSIALAYRIGESTARKVIQETCTAIIKVLAPTYLQAPKEEDWLKICEGFWTNWNLPNCCGAVDGKHVQIQAPPNSGSLYFNYKKTFSIILMAACDYNYKFTLIDVGAYGSNSDGGVFSRSKFGEAMYNGNLNLPKGEATLPGSATKTACFFVGYEAFQLTRNMMRPPVEHRIYCPPNFIDNEQEDGTITPGTWRSECSSMNNVEMERLRPTAHRATAAAYKQRDDLADYLISSEGKVPWQDEYVNRGWNGPDLIE